MSGVNMQKVSELYRGKAKTVFVTEDPNMLILEFRDDTSAFDGEKIEQLSRKGEVNNKFNHFIMQQLEAAGIKTQVEALINDNESLVKKLSMIPVECVVRNFAAGSLCKRLGVEEGLALSPQTFEFFLKNDALHDPMINESHCVAFGWASLEQIEQMKSITFEVNKVLTQLFDKGGMLLVDFKLEFGTDNDGNIILGDEFTPDGCRLWDKETKKKLDKDRFRQGLGSVVESYIEVASRIGLDLR
jgi:phosphoribosylaminoimidazole-succinocarboxamide synthase